MTVLKASMDGSGHEGTQNKDGILRFFFLVHTAFPGRLVVLVRVSEGLCKTTMRPSD